MSLPSKVREHAALGRYLAKWLLISAPLAAVIGSSVALFLWLLDRATEARLAHPTLLFALPAAGLLVGLLYHRFGQSVEGGNNVVMDQIHEPGGGVPARMAPLVLAGTVLTHLFGGSAGREGTAVQMGGSIASTLGRAFGLSEGDVRTLLTVGVAAGFGAVFGTPLTGAIFAIEVLVIGRIESDAIVPALLGSVLADWTVRAWGIHHTLYRIAPLPGAPSNGGILHVQWLLLGKIALAAVLFGLASVLFAELTHGLHRVWKVVVPAPVFRPVVGGLIIIAFVYALGTRDYIGLGVGAPGIPGTSIVSSFHAGGAAPLGWWWKTLFTAVTLSSGFKGGEVTPLFFIGATLGNALATLLHAPVDLLAGIGFVAVFAGATNTPLACTVMGIELFGAEHAVYIAVACFLAYLFSGHSGIYLSQRIGNPKTAELAVLPETSLRVVRELRPDLGHLAAVAALHDQKPQTLSGEPMPHRHDIHARKLGIVRIYLTPKDRYKPTGARFFRSRPLYRALIDAAKADGIPNAVAHQTQYGYTTRGRIQVAHPELPNAELNLFVELIAPTEQLAHFCRKHAELLAGRTVIHKHADHWEMVPSAAARPHDDPELQLA